MSHSSGPRSPRRVPVLIVIAAVLTALLFVDPVSAVPQAATAPVVDLSPMSGEDVSVVEVVLTGSDQLDELVATGVDLDHHVSRTENGVVVHAVITTRQAASLRAAGFKLGNVLYRPDDAKARIDQREATIAEHVADNQAFAATIDSAASDIKIIRADYFTSGTDQVLSVEAKWAQGPTAPDSLVVERDSGPGTEFGSGGTQVLTRFVDAGVYLYHRGASLVTTRPDRVRITSPTGDVAIARAQEWLPIPETDPEGPGYQKDFVTSYLTPSELYARIHQLAADFPDLAEIVELPHRTNGYRRKAQAVFATADPGRFGVQQGAHPAFAVDSVAWGHEGGNAISVEIADPGAAGRPLSVSLAGSSIQVSLATDTTGAPASTGAQVVAALNANAGSLVRAYTFRGDAGGGLVAAAPLTPLTDGLSAPAAVSREPHPVYVIRIGKRRDGSKPGVLAYAQEHAREWVPPLVTIETAERLLRNYAHDSRTRQLLDNLDIWIAPSLNPDGGHYSFYDYALQRKNMTNYCPYSGAADLHARHAWGVDNNRNYSEYSLFDGYFGASANCVSGLYAGPSELSEPENKNLDWLAARPNIRFSMNLHSSGNYFMWSPGAYAVPGRISAPQPTLAEESYFWGASSRILTAIKRHRNMAVTPAHTGPIADVLYSAAGNSADLLWYKYGVYAWNFEVGTSFQPEWPEAHDETMEFANGLVELMHVAHDFDSDKTRPRSELSVVPGSTPGMVDVRFEVSEPAAVFYTLDSTKPTYASILYAAAGIREGGQTLTMPIGTRIHWFSVDAAGNIENKYKPDGSGQNFRKGTAVPTD